MECAKLVSERGRNLIVLEVSNSQKTFCGNLVHTLVYFFALCLEVVKGGGILVLKTCGFCFFVFLGGGGGGWLVGCVLFLL